jgi:hypothetical protein
LDEAVETEESALEVTSSVLAEVVSPLHYHRNVPRRLDTETGHEVVGTIAPLATTNLAALERLVSRTAEILGTEEPNDWLANALGAERSERAAGEFLGHTYAGDFVTIARANDAFPEVLYERATETAQATSDPATCLVVFHSRALPWFSAGTDPESEPAIHEQLFGRALRTDDVDPSDRYAAYLERLGRSEDHDPAWFAHLVVDATERLRTGALFPADRAARLDFSVAAVADAIHRFDRARGRGGEIPVSALEAAERLESEESELFEKFAEPVVDRLEEEHDALLAALEWRTALGLD